MAPAKEEPMAFMPSSNDPIHTRRDSEGFPTPWPSFSAHRPSFDATFPQADEIAVLSPTSRPVVGDGNNMSYRGLPLRQSIPSASQLPHQISSTADHRSQKNWEELYWELEGHHQNLVSTLRQRVKHLEAELRKSRNDSGFSSSYSWQERRSNEDKIHHSQSESGSSNNGISPRNSDRRPNGSTDNSNVHEDAGQRRIYPSTYQAPTSSHHPLFSIPEGTNGQESSSDHGDHGAITPDSNDFSPDRIEEDPRSPPSTAKAMLSPPHLRTHAGRTPPHPSMIHERSTNLNDASSQIPHFEATSDDDPALSEPRIIKNASDIDLLSGRLQQVKDEEDEEGSVPLALRSEPFPQAEVSSNGVGSGSGVQSRAGQGPDPEGIVLKRKASTNFGVPFGVVRNDVPRRS